MLYGRECVAQMPHELLLPMQSNACNTPKATHKLYCQRLKTRLQGLCYMNNNNLNRLLRPQPRHHAAS